jgi:hypothetical protein
LKGGEENLIGEEVVAPVKGVVILIN